MEKITSESNSKKIILLPCGGTGASGKPYEDAGYDVRNITLPNYDVRLLEYPGYVYGILATPSCTHLARSGARWWKEKGEKALLEALVIVDACLRLVVVCKPHFWILENPVGRLTKYLGKPKMYFQPNHYGDPYTKKTCIWGDFNFPLHKFVEPTEGSKMHKLPPTEDRAILRSITPSGFAQAFFEANR